ncbi:hypothetical protein C1646_753358 [Rhizophagus diaphanus]|nr:hypothetical protein C1646_753358 [Rhizophagus diaphanus] [Rhizophagus sp. MUCL 43196]
MEQKERTKILDRIKKDLQTVEESNLFDVLRKRKAREILDDWKRKLDYSSEGMTSNSDELFVRRLDYSSAVFDAWCKLFRLNWVSSRSLENGSDNAFVNVGHLQVNQLNQLATGSCAILHDNRCMKHHRDSNNEEEIPSTEEVTAPSKKVSSKLKLLSFHWQTLIIPFEVVVLSLKYFPNVPPSAYSSTSEKKNIINN